MSKQINNYLQEIVVLIRANFIFLSLFLLLTFVVKFLITHKTEFNNWYFSPPISGGPPRYNV